MMITICPNDSPYSEAQLEMQSETDRQLITTLRNVQATQRIAEAGFETKAPRRELEARRQSGSASLAVVDREW